MKCKLLIFFLFIYFFSNAQKTLVLDTERPNKVKHTVFYVKDEISLKLYHDRKTYTGKIVAIGDSALLITTGKTYDTIRVKDIRMLIFNRSNHLTSAFSRAFVIAGFGVMGLDIVNNTLNHESQIVKPRIILTGACLITAGLLIKLYETKRCRLGKRKRLRVAELSPY